MSSNDPSSSSATSNTDSNIQHLNRSQTLPLHTTTVVEIIGQVPEPLSPSDKKSASEDTSLSAAILQQKASQSKEAQLQIEADPSVTQDSNSSTKGINLPLPASSSLVEQEQNFPRPLRTQTVPTETFTTASGESISPQQLTSSKTFPVRDSTATVAEPDPTMDGQQPFIAELPGTPVPQNRVEGADTQKMDREIALEQSARLKATKSEDAAVIYDIPVTPSAQAFEIANKNTIGGQGYFEPMFPGDKGKEVEAPKVEAA